MTTVAKFRTEDNRSLLRECFYAAKKFNQRQEQRWGGSTSPILEYHGTTPGSRTMEYVRNKSGTRQQSLTDARAKLFVIGCLLDVSWNTNWATTKTDVATAVSALSV